ncbi:MAG: hypothetical protein DCF25_13390 [Leptolyngbya foveolarum]|uniref:Uncharacterized protein n=1 Tax=Leptolyngbya foveolarum TaxID=47253 RepID=A0A2W4U490_9CYAN|nr:MAG: hypothetical protein DCF25_13390 [Leptolyngbya foveolarum]
MNSEEDFEIRGRVKITESEELYRVTDQHGHTIEYDKADGRELFNHYRHNMTNYDQVLNDIRTDQGYVSNRQSKQATTGSAEQIIEIYRDEHVRVIRDSQKKGHILKTLMQKVGVGTASALSQTLDAWSSKLKEVARLENSQRTLQVWNDTYRVQRELVKEVLVREDVPEEVKQNITAIYKTRSVGKATALGEELFELEKSEVLKLVKSAIRYSKL